MNLIKYPGCKPEVLVKRLKEKREKDVKIDELRTERRAIRSEINKLAAKAKANPKEKKKIVKEIDELQTKITDIDKFINGDGVSKSIQLSNLRKELSKRLKTLNQKPKRRSKKKDSKDAKDAKESKDAKVADESDLSLKEDKINNDKYVKQLRYEIETLRKEIAIDQYVRYINTLETDYRSTVTPLTPDTIIVDRFNKMRFLYAEGTMCDKIKRITNKMHDTRELMGVDPDFDYVYKHKWIRFVFSDLMLTPHYSSETIIGFNEHGFIIGDIDGKSKEFIAFEALRLMVATYFDQNDIHQYRDTIRNWLVGNTYYEKLSFENQVKLTEEMIIDHIAYKLLVKPISPTDFFYRMIYCEKDADTVSESMYQLRYDRLRYLHDIIIKEKILEATDKNKKKKKKEKPTIDLSIPLAVPSITSYGFDTVDGNSIQEHFRVCERPFELIYPLPKNISIAKICAQMSVVTAFSKFNNCMEAIFVAYGGTVAAEFRRSADWLFNEELGIETPIMDKVGENTSFDKPSLAEKLYEKYKYTIQQIIYPMYKEYLDSNDLYTRDKLRLSILNILYVLAYTGEITLIQQNKVISDAEKLAQELNHINMNKADTSKLLSYKDKVKIFKKDYPQKPNEDDKAYDERIRILIINDGEKKFKERTVRKEPDPIDDIFNNDDEITMLPIEKIISRGVLRPTPLDPFLSPDHTVASSKRMKKKNK